MYFLHPLGDVASKIVEGARLQLVEPAAYTVGYFKLGYPNGDIPRSKGVCTDVVIRSLRHAGFDLQKLIHDDAKANRAAYPRIQKLDTNIDHRRVPNQAVYFTRNQKRLSLFAWRPGDIVWWKLPNGLDHIGVLSDRRGQSGELMVIHNIRTTAEEDVLNKWKIVGHYRWIK